MRDITEECVQNILREENPSGTRLKEACLRATMLGIYFFDFDSVRDVASGLPEII